MTNFTPGQRVTRNADNANGTVREITPDGVIVDMDHGTDVLGTPSAFRPEDEITDGERAAALASWPTLTADQVDNAELPAGMQRLVSVNWTTEDQQALGNTFGVRIFARDEQDARRQIARDFCQPGTPASAVIVVSVAFL